ncbi:hypothetical protein MRX96_002292 [Rhipicephalus microplus]
MHIFDSKTTTRPLNRMGIASTYGHLPRQNYEFSLHVHGGQRRGPIFARLAGSVTVLRRNADLCDDRLQCEKHFCRKENDPEARDRALPIAESDHSSLPPHESIVGGASASLARSHRQNFLKNLDHLRVCGPHFISDAAVQTYVNMSYMNTLEVDRKTLVFEL